MTTVVVEGVGPVTLPDNMTREEMEAAIAMLPTTAGRLLRVQFGSRGGSPCYRPTPYSSCRECARVRQRPVAIGRGCC